MVREANWCNLKCRRTSQAQGLPVSCKRWAAAGPAGPSKAAPIRERPPRPGEGSSQTGAPRASWAARPGCSRRRPRREPYLRRGRQDAGAGAVQASGAGGAAATHVGRPRGAPGPASGWEPGCGARGRRARLLGNGSTRGAAASPGAGGARGTRVRAGPPSVGPGVPAPAPRPSGRHGSEHRAARARSAVSSASAFQVLSSSRGQATASGRCQGRWGARGGDACRHTGERHLLSAYCVQTLLLAAPEAASRACAEKGPAPGLRLRWPSLDILSDF